MFCDNSASSSLHQLTDSTPELQILRPPEASKCETVVNFGPPEAQKCRTVVELLAETRGAGMGRRHWGAGVQVKTPILHRMLYFTVFWGGLGMTPG